MYLRLAMWDIKNTSLTIGSGDSYDASLSSANELEEVIVTSLGIKREKQALGYAVSEVDEALIEQRAEGDIGRVLSGKASGVQITNQSGISGSGTSSSSVDLTALVKETNLYLLLTEFHLVVKRMLKMTLLTETMVLLVF